MRAVKNVVCSCGKLLIQTSSGSVCGEKLCSACKRRIHFEAKGEEVLVQAGTKQTGEQRLPIMERLKFLESVSAIFENRKRCPVYDDIKTRGPCFCLPSMLPLTAWAALSLIL